MRVAFISADYNLLHDGFKTKPTAGGAGFARCELPAKSISEFGGIDARVFSAGNFRPDGELVGLDAERIGIDTRSAILHGGFDVVVLQRWLAPNIAEMIAKARSTGQIVIQDLDDHFWAFHKSHSAQSWKTDEIIDGYAKTMRASTHVTVSTPFLADVVRSLGQPNVTVLSNMIDLRRWNRQDVRDDVQTIGWCGVTQHRSFDLEQVGSAVRYFLRDHRDVRFIHGGHIDGTQFASDALRIPKSRCVRRDTQPPQRYPRLWDGIDIALCPLNPVDFNRAKSSIKAMESSAAGIPYIASDLDEYRTYGCGRLVSSPQGWSEALDDLQDVSVRRSLADAAHDRVLLEDCSVRWRDWADLYGRLIQASPSELAVSA